MGCIPLAIGVGGVVVATLSPEGAFVWFRQHVVGMAHPATEPFVLHDGHRVLAVVGALLAGFVLWRVALRPVDTPAPLRGRWFILATAGFVGTAVFNVRWAGVQQGLWEWWLPELSVLYFPTVVVFSVSALAAIGPRRWLGLDRTAASQAAGLGIAYGAFSSLWHCCAPLWTESALPWPLFLLAFAAWGVAFAGYVAGVGVRLGQPWGELSAAGLFAVGYPWHTPLWFVQGAVGGVFVVWLARCSSSLITPGIFVGTAYAVHTTIPFMLGTP